MNSVPVKITYGDDLDHYFNLYDGFTAYVVGKGVSFDAWKSDGFKLPPKSISIGINHVYKFAPVKFSTTCHPTEVYGNEKINIPCFSGYRINQCPVPTPLRSFTFSTDQHRRFQQLKYTKEQILDMRKFYCASSSSQPAIHLAWLMGCTDIVLIGCDGGSGYSECFDKSTLSDSRIYNLIRRDNERMLNILYPGRWKDYQRFE